VFSSQNKPATSNQRAVLFSQNKPAPAISHQPTEQAMIGSFLVRIFLLQNRCMMDDGCWLLAGLPLL
jgi:hypothetical protein